jgi:RNA recognition motif-containing protein
MGKELYVRHISDKATENDIRKLFSVAGTVSTVHLITDPDTGQFKGCAFVKMASENDAKEAITTLDGALLINRVILVEEARPQKQKPGKSGGYQGKSGQDGRPRRGHK